MVSTGLTRARRFQAALALDPIPASKVQSAPRQFAELDTHNSKSHHCLASAFADTLKSARFPERHIHSRSAFESALKLPAWQAE